MKRTLFLLILCSSLSVSALWFIEGTRGQNTNSQPPRHTEIKIDSKLFDDFVGQFSFLDNPDQIFSIFRDGGKFILQSPTSSKLEIVPESNETFFLKASEGSQIIFVRNKDGKVMSALWRVAGIDRELRRISNSPVVEVLYPLEKREAMIPMRDGVKLHTVVFTPQNQREALPMLLNRTPYGVGGNSDSVNRNYRELVADGYIFVFQDIRGRYASEGQFVMDRPMRDKRDPKSIDESTDTYDTIDWLIKNVANTNGRVGIFGISYDGWLSAVATIDAHPALKAASPQAPMTDAYLGDDFFHNGAFRQTYGYEYAKSMETSKENTEVSFDKDAYDWYLQLGSLAKLTAETGGKLPTWNAFVAHPNYDEYWKARAAQRYLKQTSVPTLVVGGWWDQEDFYGTLKAYETLEKTDRNHQNFIVLGPWNHGGWTGYGRRLGAIDFESSTGIYFRRQIQTPWFAYYLKGKATLKVADGTTFQTGSNKWTSWDRWPPKEAINQDLFLRSGKKLSFSKPTANEEFETYVSDPANPVPYRKRPIEATYDPKGSRWNTWLVQDQRFLQGRTDVLTWQSDVLDQDLIVSGDIIAHLFASTTGTDSDWVVKLIDVYPEDYPEDKRMAGYQLMIADEILRGRFRSSFEKSIGVSPNQVNEYVIDLHSNNHCFRKGHRLMVQVQSSWFPLYDRNPQKFVANIFTAQPADFQSATQHVYESARYPSHVSLSVVK